MQEKLNSININLNSIFILLVIQWQQTPIIFYAKKKRAIPEEEKCQITFTVAFEKYKMLLSYNDGTHIKGSARANVGKNVYYE